MKPLFAIAVLAAVTACERERRVEREPVQAPRQKTETSVAEGKPPAAEPPTIAVAGVATCQPEAQVTAGVARMVDMADTDADGRVSNAEALGLTNFLIGGFFFQADGNGDGTITPEEGRKARETFSAQYPVFATLLVETKKATGQSPFKTVAEFVDIEYGKPVTIEEARRAARAAMSDLYRVADTNRDGFITAGEARTASWEGARSLGTAVFNTADGNKDGSLNLEEFQGALDAPSKVAFDAADANKDGKLSRDEAASATAQLGRRLGVPPK